MSAAHAGRSVDHACDHLYRRHQVSLVNFARLRGCDEHEAWDIVQELFLRVFRLGMMQVLGSRPFEMQRAWLIRTLRWMLVNEHRRRSRLRRGGGHLFESVEQIIEEGGDFSAAGTPAGDYDRQWAAAVLDHCLSRLRSSVKPGSWMAFESTMNDTNSPHAPATRVAAHRTRVKLRKLIQLEAHKESLVQAFSR